MKDLTYVLTEKMALSRGLFKEIQNEIYDNYAYSTISISEAANKYKFGYVYFSEQFEFVSLIVYNSEDDIKNHKDEILGDNDENIDKVINLKAGNSLILENGIYIMRLW